MWIKPFTTEVPRTVFALFHSLGGWVVFPLLAIPMLLAWWGFAMKRRSRALALSLLPASLLPFLYGITTCFRLVFQGFDLLATNPAASAPDLGFILYRCFFPFFLGATVSFFAVPLACLAIARSQDPGEPLTGSISATLPVDPLPPCGWADHPAERSRIPEQTRNDRDNP